MDWNDIKGLIGKGAPLIGTLLGGPAGGAVASLVANALGVEDTPDAISAALKSDPGALLKLKELEFTHKTRFQELMLEETKAHLADRQSARQREIEIQKAGGSNKLMYILGSLIVVGFFASLIVLLFKTTAIPAGSRDAIMLLFGSLIASFGAVVQYFFGSSKGSSDKTALLVNKK